MTAFKVYDDLFLGSGDKIPQFQFDVANATSFELDWFGIRHYSDQNASYVYASKKAGLIEHAGYSLYLDDKDKIGTLLLGAIDSAKYEDDLALFDNTDYQIRGKSITTRDGNVIQFTSPSGIDSGDTHG